MSVVAGNNYFQIYKSIGMRYDNCGPRLPQRRAKAAPVAIMSKQLPSTSGFTKVSDDCYYELHGDGDSMDEDIDSSGVTGEIVYSKSLL